MSAYRLQLSAQGAYRAAGIGVWQGPYRDAGFRVWTPPVPGQGTWQTHVGKVAMGETFVRSRNRSKTPYRPKGASAHSYQMPPQPADGAPLVIVNAEFIPHNEAESIKMFERISDCQYLVGNISASGTGIGVKGQGGTPAQMISGSEPSAVFARKWLARDKSQDKWEPGFDGERLTLQQAWCKHLMARRMHITRGYRGENSKEPRHFRVRVCPESKVAARLAKGNNLDQFMREYMKRVQNDLERDLYWVAAGHWKPSLRLVEKNEEAITAWNRKPDCHAHYAFRGVDGAGEAVFIEAPYVKKGMVWRARTLLQEMYPEEVRRAG